MDLAGVLVGNAIAIAALLVVVWIVSVIVHDASIIDPVWGPGFVLVAWVTFLRLPEVTARALLVVVLVSVWGLRLGVYLAWRNLGKGEDPRYVAMRRRRGEWFWLISLGTVFAVQGVLMWIVSLPVQVGMPRAAGSLGWLDAVGTAMWTVGVAFEAVGDAQLARFKADPANRGKVMDRGLWRYTRHPNYFGDFMVWWGIFVIVARVAWWSVAGPVVMSVLLIRVSGVALLEKDIGSRRPGYGEYVRRTSSFFPRPPRA